MNENSGADDILEYVKKHGVVAKDDDRPAGISHNGNAGKKKRLRRSVDLHGKTVREAEELLAREFPVIRERGFKELLIIHGYGIHSQPGEGPVLKKAVRDLLENRFSPFVRAISPALPKDGGEGATLVRIR